MVIVKSGVIGIYFNIFGKYLFFFFKVFSGGCIIIEVDEDVNVFVEFKFFFVDVVFGGVIIGRYFRVDVLLLNIVFSGIL